ncbi:MAG: protease modulator HflC [Kiritimatiellae bacterium]|nr:protease modulator HflC [Kiritimatiellia bacterium]MDD4341885.1 protease modulator HflC [Kiritimatiellia bacterium]
MKRILLIAFAIALVAVFMLVLCTYQVDFDQTAIRTTFGRATETDVINADGQGAGLHLKWPWPIQDVLLFERRTHLFTDTLEQQETQDKQVVILRTYLAWRIAAPLDFYRSFRTPAYGERFLAERLRSARSEIGRFTFDDLTNTDPEHLRIADAERALLERMRGELDGQHTGIDVLTVGISRIILPEQITRSVFARMSQTRQRLAQQARSEGEAMARGIRAKTDRDRDRILAFAEREAQRIRAEGDAAAAESYAVFAEDEDLAIFLRNLDALHISLANNATFLLDTRLAPFDLLQSLHSASSAPAAMSAPAPAAPDAAAMPHPALVPVPAAQPAPDAIPTPAAQP